MKESLKALKRIGIMLLILFASLIVFIPNKVKGATVIDDKGVAADHRWHQRKWVDTLYECEEYDIHTLLKHPDAKWYNRGLKYDYRNYTITLKIGETIHLKMIAYDAIQDKDVESGIANWMWTDPGDNLLEQLINLKDATDRNRNIIIHDNDFNVRDVYITGRRIGKQTYNVSSLTQKTTLTVIVEEDPIYAVAISPTRENMKRIIGDDNNDGLVTTIDNMLSDVNGEIRGTDPDGTNVVMTNQQFQIVGKNTINTNVNDGKESNIIVTSSNPNAVEAVKLNDTVYQLITKNEGFAQITVYKDYTAHDGQWSNEGQKGDTIKMRVIKNNQQDSLFDFRVEYGLAYITKYKGTAEGDVDIPNEVTDENGNKYTVIGIDANAFKDTNVTKITIPKTVGYIDVQAFNGALKLKKIDVVAENQGGYFTENENGILYRMIGAQKDIRALIRCPQNWEGTSLDISATNTQIIGSYAFYNCNKLRNITLPASLNTIRKMAFNGSNNRGLVLELPNDIASFIDEQGNEIGTNIFGGVSEVKYYLSKEQTVNGVTKRVATDTAKLITKYIIDCSEISNGTVFTHMGPEPDSEPADDDYTEVQPQDGKYILEIGLNDRNKKYKITIKPGQKVEVVPKVKGMISTLNDNLKFDFGYDTDDRDMDGNPLNYKQYVEGTRDPIKDIIKIGKIEIPTGIVNYKYFVKGLKETTFRRADNTTGADMVLYYGGNLNNNTEQYHLYKINLRVIVQGTQPIFAVGENTIQYNENEITADFDHDGLLTYMDLEIYSRKPYEERQALPENIREIFTNFASNAKNKVKPGDKVKICAQEYPGAEKEINNIQFIFETGSNLITKTGNEIKFKEGVTGEVKVRVKRSNQTNQSQAITFVIDDDLRQNDLYKYRINADNTVTILKYLGTVGENKTLVFPDYIENKKVTGLDSRIFDITNDKSNINKIVIGNFIENISEDAFIDLPNIKEFIVAENNKAFKTDMGILYRLKYTLNEYARLRDEGFVQENEYILVRCPNDTVSMMIPTTLKMIDGTEQVKVTEIANKAFYNLKFLNRVITTNNITKIGNSAFERCAKLATINIPSNLITIGTRAFAYCTGLVNTKLEIPMSLQDITWAGNEVGRIFYNAKVAEVSYFPAYDKDGNEISFMSNYRKGFYGYVDENGKIKHSFNVLSDMEEEPGNVNVHYVIKDSLDIYDTENGIIYKRIPDGGNSVEIVGLTGNVNPQLVIPATVWIKDDKVVPAGTEGAIEFRVIRITSLSENGDITKITIGANISEIADGVFDNMNRLESIDVALGNLNYISNYDMLYRINKNDNPNTLTLIRCPIKASGEKKVDAVGGMPVIEIANGAFKNCKDITKVILAGTIKKIGNEAFKGCENLENLVIPSNLTSLGSNVFDGITGPVIEYLTGNNIDNIDEYIKNAKLFTYNMQYDDVTYMIVVGDQLGFVNCYVNEKEKGLSLNKIKLNVNGEPGYEGNIVLTDYSGTRPFTKVFTYRVPKEGNYEIVLSDGSKDVSVGTLNASATTYRYFVNYIPNIEPENIVKMPEKGIKEYNGTVKISEIVPEAHGVAFREWKTKPDGSGDKYELGANYSENEDLDLYAIWIPDMNALSGIRVQEGTAKTSYVVGQSFDRTGMVVLAVYPGKPERTQEIHNYTIENENRKLTEGKNIIKISYTENYITKHYELEVTAEAKAIVEINVTTNPRKTTYVEGQSFNPDGMVITATYNDGTTFPVTDFRIVNGENLQKPEDGKPFIVQIEYAGKTAECPVIIETKELDKIDITKNPKKMSYVEGQSFDGTEMEITAYYKKDPENTLAYKIPAEEYEVLNTEKLPYNGINGEPYTYIVTIKYNGKYATLPITVNAKKIESLEIVNGPDKAEYVEGQDFNPAGLVVKTTFNDGTSFNRHLDPLYEDGLQPTGDYLEFLRTTKFEFENDKKLELGQTSVTIKATYTNPNSGAIQTETKECAITVNSKKLSGIVLEKIQDEEYTEGKTIVFIDGQTVDRSKLVVKPKYNDGTTGENNVADKCQIIPEGKVTLGMNAVKILYTEGTETKELSIPITVTSTEVSHVIIKNPPTKTTYIEEENFDKAGMVVEVTLTNGDKKEFTDNSLEVINGNELAYGNDGNNKVQVKYKDGELQGIVEQSITVNPKKVITLTKPSAKTDYVEGQDFDTSSIKALVTYDNGKSRIVEEGFTANRANDLSVGNYDIFVIYEETNHGVKSSASAPVTIKVEYKNLSDKSSLKIEEPEDKQIYIEGEEFNKDSIKVYAVFNDGRSPVKVTDFVIKDSDKILKLGQTEVEIQYTYTNKAGVTTTQTGKCTNFQVIEKQVDSITATIPETTKQEEGKPFNPEGLEVKVKFNDSDELVTLTEGYTIENANKNLEYGTDGKTTVKISYTYKNKTVSYDLPITVIRKIPTGIRIIQGPNIVRYIEGEPFNPAGMIIHVVYSNGTEEPIDLSKFVIENGELTPGQRLIIIKYTENGVPVQIEYEVPNLEVVEKTLIGLSVDPSSVKKTYTEGDMFDPTGLKVFAHYDNNKSEPITSGYIINNGQPLVKGQDRVQIEYSVGGVPKYEYITGITVNAKPAVLEKIQIISGPTKTEYIEGENFDKSGMVVVAKYTDGTQTDISDLITIVGGNNLTYGKTSVTIYYPNTTPVTQPIVVNKAVPVNPIREDSDIEIIDDRYIGYIQPETDIEILISSIADGYTLKILKSDKKTEVTSGLIGTGMYAMIYRGDQKVFEYEIVVIGDVDGNGLANIKDMVKINKHRLHKITLEGAYFEAADVNGDGLANIKDMVKINKFRLGKITQF